MMNHRFNNKGPARREQIVYSSEAVHVLLSDGFCTDHRLRPILMTAIATVGALLPLAFGFESGGLISKGMAVTVIGGLTSSTLLTLIIVPIVYEFLNRKKKQRTAEEA